MTDRTDRIQKDEFVRRIAKRMNTNQETAAIWVDAILDTLYEAFKKGTSVTLTGFGGFYVRPERKSWVFKFNPGQKLRAFLGWSSSYRGKL